MSLFIAKCIVGVVLLVAAVCLGASLLDTLTRWRTWYREALQNTAILTVIVVVVWAFAIVLNHL